MNLLWDSARKCIDMAEWFGDKENISGWRKPYSWQTGNKKHLQNELKNQ
jgi:hypothetical protein